MVEVVKKGKEGKEGKDKYFKVEVNLSSIKRNFVSSAKLVGYGAAIAGGKLLYSAGFHMPSSPADGYIGGATSMFGGFVMVASVAGIAYTINKNEDLKKAFLYAAKKLGQGIELGYKGYTKAAAFYNKKISPFVKVAAEKVSQEANNYFGNEGMDVYGPRKNGKSGTEYYGTILDNGKKIVKPLTWLRSHFNKGR